jgi:outer membrane protein assembly factor BamB
VYAATENNSVYALDTSTGTQLWHQHLAAPAALNQLPCGNINPYGITGTPAIDTTSNVLYVVALQSTPSVHHELYALNLAAGGGVLYHFPIDAPGSSPPSQGQRGSLTLTNGKVYVVYSGRAGDCAPYVGRVVAVNVGDASGTSMLSYSLPGTSRGGIWAAASSDTLGNVYVATGNSDARGSTPDHGESVIKLSAGLQEQDFFTAPEWASLNAGDLDIGSLGPMPLQNGWILQSGKNGKGYLIDSRQMSTNPNHVGGMLFEGQVCSGGEQAIGFGAYLAPSTVFVPCSNSLQAVHVATGGPPGFTVTAVRTGYSGSQASSPPILSGGVLWNLDRGTANGTPLLLGFDPSSLAQLFSVPLAASPHEFAAPAAGAGLIVVPQGQSIAAFGLVNGPAPTATPTPLPTRTSTPTNTAVPPPPPSGGGGRSGGGGGGGGGSGGGGHTVPVNVPSGGGGGGGGGGAPAAPVVQRSAPPPSATPTPTATAVATLEPRPTPEAAPIEPVQIAGAMAVGPISVAIDPTVGGTLTTPDGALNVVVPPGAAGDVLLCSLTPVDPITGAANLQVAAQYYALSVSDGAGNAVVSFDQPITLIVVPTQDVDPSSMLIAAFDPAAGALVTLQSEVQPDGTLEAQLTSLGPPTNLTAQGRYSE